MTFRFTLSHSVLGSQVISEPDGWSGAILKLERDKDLFSLIETFNGGANSAFIFYGNNGTENGGIDFIRQVETTYGFDANITFLVEYAPDDVTFSTLFSGLLDLPSKNEMKDNKMQVPVIRDDFWAKFINRFETPVNISDTVDLDGNAVAPVGPIEVNLTSQTLRKTHYSYEPDKGIVVTIEIGSADLFIQYTPGEVETDEMEDFYHLTPINNPEKPVSTFDVAEAGTYAFDVQWTMSAIFGSTENHVNNLNGIYLQVNEEDPIAFSVVDDTLVGTDITIFSLSTTLYLLVGDTVRIYAEAIDSSQTINYGFWGTNGLYHEASGYDRARPAGMDEVPTYTRVTADTVYPETQVQCYLIHDLFHAVCVRLGLGNDPFYSEFLGSTLTQTKAYDSDGCGWMYAIVKGLQLRGYTLAEKPFFVSFKQLWEGINPILNLACGYETVNSVQVIRIEQKTSFFGATAPVNFSNVREISSSYDQDYIFKTIKTGYKKWQSEDISGLDDPQTKHTRATRFVKTGVDLNLQSDFIAAGLAIEITRRTTREKSADYKFDNDNFIISLNTNDLSPDVYVPELDEAFSSVTNLLNSDTRYNLLLTPMRNLLRWGDYISGCMQSYLSSNFKFVSGEGNYDMESNANNEITCVRYVDSNNLAESDDISPNGLGFLFLPQLFDITIPMEKEEYDLIDRKEPIGISQSTTGHVDFHIKELEYDLLKGEAKIKAWPTAAFSITVPEQTMPVPPCASDSVSVVYDAAYQAVLNYGDLQGYDLPSLAQRAVENQIVVDLKAQGIWDDLDLFYHFETDGDENFAKINWKNPGTHNLVESGTVTFTSGQGFTGNASTGYLNTGWVPDTDAVNFTLDEAGAFVKVNNNYAAGNKCAFGVRGNGGGALLGQVLLMPEDASSTHTYSIHCTAPAVGSAVDSNGFYHIRRVADNDMRLFKNGSQVGATSTSASDSLSTRELYLLALNANGAGAGFHSDAQIGCFGIGASLTGKESALNTILG